MSLGAVAIRISGQPTWELMRSIVCLKSPSGFKYMTVGEPRYYVPTDDAANQIVADVLADSKLEWVLFVDDDAVIHPQTLMRLLSWNVPIVSAMAFTRTTPVIALAMKVNSLPDGKHDIDIKGTIEWLNKWPQLLTKTATLLPVAPLDSLIEVGFTGLHCTLIQREVLENVPMPQFLTDDAKKSEDHYFCDKARKHGFKTYLDRSVVAGHIGQHEFAGLDFQAWVLWMQAREEFLKLNELQF